MGFMNIIPATYPKGFTSKTNFSKYLLIVDAYQNILKMSGMEIITTEEVMDKIDLFQPRFGTMGKFGWWDLEIFQHMKVRSLPPQCSRMNVKPAVLDLR